MHALATLTIGLIGAVLLVLMLQDGFEVMLLPRRVQRRVRVVGILFRLAWKAWAAIGRRVPAERGREGFLSHFGPLSMLLLIEVWFTILIVGFGMVQWALQGAPISPLSEQIYMSGVTFFTLGYGDVVPHSGAGRFVAVFEAGIGIGFLAIVIGYLPVLYQFFSRREAHVIQLDGRAGSPPCAATLLTRHAVEGGFSNLEGLLREWEVWSSELLESHLSYPMLAYYRSQHDEESWLAALGCIMDTCALALVGVRDLPSLQARMTFTMARQVLVEMARSFSVTPQRDTGPDRLDADGYTRLVATLERAGVVWEAEPDGMEMLAALRSTYEPLLDGLSSYLMLKVPSWTPATGAVDNWERGPRGLIASRLIAELSAMRGAGGNGPGNPGPARWQGLLRRLRRGQRDRQ